MEKQITRVLAIAPDGTEYEYVVGEVDDDEDKLVTSIQRNDQSSYTMAYLVTFEDSSEINLIGFKFVVWSAKPSVNSVHNTDYKSVA